MPPCLKIYVAPEGDDSGPGTVDSPFRTLGRARDEARLHRSEDRPIEMVLGGGTYFLGEPLVLDRRDTGTASAPIKYRNAEGQAPVISGGRCVSQWVMHDAEAGICQADVMPGVCSRQCFVNGRRARRARLLCDGSWERTERGFNCPPMLARWRRPSDLEVVGRSGWKEFRGRVSHIEDGEAVMSQPFWSNAQLHTPHWTMDKAHWVENAYESLTDEGEWYLDATDGRLYYKPLPHEDPASRKAVLPVRETLIEAHRRT